MLRLSINGFGRIGRTAFKAGFTRPGIKFVAINDMAEPASLAHLLAHDSVFRAWGHSVKAKGHALVVDGQEIPVYAQTDPAQLPWKEHRVDVVLECTGRFTDAAASRAHLEAGAKAVVISAPAEDTPTKLMGVNHETLKHGDRIVNNASCTTNSTAPVAVVMEEAFGIKKAMMTTVHSVTAEQNLVDGVPPKLHPDLRRARSALINMIPTSTGAAKATAEALPKLKGKFDGVAIRVPTIDVSLTDFTFLLARKTTGEEVRAAFVKAAAARRWKGILGVSDEPLVSSDFIGTTYSAVVDLPMLRVVDGDLVKVLAWYDNEWGYSHRLIDMASEVGRAIAE